MSNLLQLFFMIEEYHIIIIINDIIIYSVDSFCHTANNNIQKPLMFN